MIAAENVWASFVRLLAPLVYKRDEKIAEKLLDFAATEAGSALDMLAAAELTDDPKLRRQFFRHALDEAKHARMFQQAARSLVPTPKARKWSFVHATRQNLYRRLGHLPFLAFVHLAERRGEAHFVALTKHFEDRPELADMLARIAKDEKFHVSYTGRALERSDRKLVRRVLLQTRLRGAWQAWRRQGRIIGDLIGRGILALVFITIVPFFALTLRLLEPERPGWKKPKKKEGTP